MVKDFFKRLVSTDNSINEAVMVAGLLLVPFIFGYFLEWIPITKLDLLGDMILICLGIGGARAVGVSYKKS